MILGEALQGHLHHANGALHDHLPGVNDGAGLLALEHDGGDLRRVGEVCDPGLDDLQAGVRHLGLDLVPDAARHHLAGASEAALVGLAVSGGVDAGGHVVGVDADDVPQGGVALQGEILLVVVHVEDRGGGVCHPPHDGDADLNGVAQAVVDLLAGIVEGHDLQGDLLVERLRAGGLVGSVEGGLEAVLPAVHVRGLVELGLGGGVHGGAEGVHEVEALPLQRADVPAEEGQHQGLLGL